MSLRHLLIILIFLSSAAGLSQSAELHFEESVHKFPKTYEGVVIEHDFKVTNTGQTPLILSDYKVACTCTKATLPKGPIAPGETAIIKVSFDTNGKYYFQDRTIQITANTKKQIHQLRFKVNVIPRNE